jgi:hypothetical protein
MIGVDWSEIRHYKNNFMLENYEDEDMQKLENFITNYKDEKEKK